MPSKDLRLAVFLFVAALTVASAENWYYKITTYTDDQCSNTYGGYYVRTYINEPCRNDYDICTASGNFWVKALCYSTDPLLEPQSSSFVKKVNYANDACLTDTPYVEAWAAPKSTCFMVPDPDVATYRFSGCNENPVALLEYYSDSSTCALVPTTVPTSSDAGYSESCTTEVSNSKLFTCPPVIPVAPPTTTPPTAAPVDSTSPDFAPQSTTPVVQPVSTNAPELLVPTQAPVNAPQTTPVQAPVKKVSGAMSVTSYGIASLVVVMLMLA